MSDQKQQESINPAIDVVQTIQRGEAPTTAKLSEVLEKSERSLDEQKLSSEDDRTRQLVRDTQSLLSATKDMLEKKNADDKVQTIISESAAAARAADEFTGVGGESLSEEDKRILREMRQRMADTATIGRDVLRLIIFHPQFREGLVNFMNIVSDLFQTVADKMKEQPEGIPLTQQAVEGVREALSEEKMKGDRRELMERIRTLLYDIRDNDVYQRGIRSLFRLLDMVKISAERAGERMEQASVQLQAEEHTQKALEQTKALAEEFLPEQKTLDPLLNRLRDLLISIKNDEALTNYLKRWRDYTETILKDPAALNNVEFRTQAERLVDEGPNLAVSSDIYNNAQSVINEWRDVLQNFKQDDQVNMLQLTLKKLMSDVTKRDEQGRTTLDMQALASFRPILVELLRKNLDLIPLPDVEGEDDTYQYRIRNIVATGEEILPDYISVDTSTHSEAAVGDPKRPTWLRGDLIFSVENIRTKLQNVEFWFKRKTFPYTEDSGFIDIDVAGGITVVIKLILQATDVGMSFTRGSVYCRADDVRCRLRETKHDFIYNLFPSLWERPIKENIEKYIAEKLAAAIKDLRDAANQRIAEYQKEGVAAALPEALKQDTPSSVVS